MKVDTWPGGIFFSISAEGFTVRRKAEFEAFWKRVQPGTIVSEYALKQLLEMFDKPPQFHRAGSVYEYRTLQFDRKENEYNILLAVRPTVKMPVHIVSSNKFDHTICYKIIPADLARGIANLFVGIEIPAEARYVRFEIGGYPTQTKMLNIPIL